MQILIDKKRLDGVISLLNNYVEKRDNSSINSNILINARTDVVILLASDKEVGINYKLYGVQVDEPGQTYVNAKKLNDILKGLNNQDLIIKSEEKIIKIIQGKTQFNIPIISEGEFIFMEEDEPRIQINLSSSALAKGLKTINSAIDAGSISVQFNCAHIEITSETICFAGSDSKIVSVYSVPNQATNSENIILTKRCVGEILKLLGEEVRVYKSENYVLLENDNFTFYAKTVSVEPLPFRAVMPKQEPKEQVQLQTDEFISEIRKLNTVSDKCVINFKPDGTLTFSSNIDSEITSDTAVTSELASKATIGEEFELCLSNKYMLDFLSANDSDEFVIKYFAPGAPVVFSGANLKALIASIKR